MSRSIGARLDRLEQGAEEQAGPDWEALARPGGWDEFVASLPPPTPEYMEAVAEGQEFRERILGICAKFTALGGEPVTPQQLGFGHVVARRHPFEHLLPPRPPSQSGFVELPTPEGQPQ